MTGLKGCSNSRSGANRLSKRRIIPESFKDLAMALSKLYKTEEQIIIEYFIHHECLEEKQLERFLKFDYTLLQSHLSNLLADRIVQKRTKDWIGPNGIVYKSRRIIYYFINYRSMINIIQLKLHWIRAEIEAQFNVKSALKQFFKCSNPKCNRTFSEGHARQLFDPKQNEYFCMYCKFIVIENDFNFQGNNNGLTVAQFNEATQPLLELMKKASESDFTCILSEPLPAILQPKNEKNEVLSVNVVGSRSSSEAPTNTNTRTGRSNDDTDDDDEYRGTKRKWSGEVTRFSRRKNNEEVNIVMSSSNSTLNRKIAGTGSGTGTTDPGNTILKKKAKTIPVWMSSPAVDFGDSQTLPEETESMEIETTTSQSASTSKQNGPKVLSSSASEEIIDSILFNSEDLVGIMSDSDLDSDSD